MTADTDAQVLRFETEVRPGVILNLTIDLDPLIAATALVTMTPADYARLAEAANAITLLMNLLVRYPDCLPSADHLGWAVSAIMCAVQGLDVPDEMSLSTPTLQPPAGFMDEVMDRIGALTPPPELVISGLVSDDPFRQ